MAGLRMAMHIMREERAALGYMQVAKYTESRMPKDNLLKEVPNFRSVRYR